MCHSLYFLDCKIKVWLQTHAMLSAKSDVSKHLQLPACTTHSSAIWRERPWPHCASLVWELQQG